MLYSYVYRHPYAYACMPLLVTLIIFSPFKPKNKGHLKKKGGTYLCKILKRDFQCSIQQKGDIHCITMGYPFFFTFHHILTCILWFSPDLVSSAADALLPLILCEQGLYQVFSLSSLCDATILFNSRCSFVSFLS